MSIANIPHALSLSLSSGVVSPTNGTVSVGVNQTSATLTTLTLGSALFIVVGGGDINGIGAGYGVTAIVYNSNGFNGTTAAFGINILQATTDTHGSLSAAINSSTGSITIFNGSGKNQTFYWSLVRMQ